MASELHLERFKAFKGTRDPNKDRVSVAINDLGALEMGLKRLIKPLRWPKTKASMKFAASSKARLPVATMASASSEQGMRPLKEAEE